MLEIFQPLLSSLCSVHILTQSLILIFLNLEFKCQFYPTDPFIKLRTGSWKQEGWQAGSSYYIYSLKKQR